MAELNAAQTAVEQSRSGMKMDEKDFNRFKKKPLEFSPKRKYTVAVISPLQKQDSCEPVANGSSGTSSSFASILESLVTRRTHARSLRMTALQPFSFDARDAERQVARERWLQEMRQVREERWGSAFKAHPVRRYKPIQFLIQNPFPTRSTSKS